MSARLERIIRELREKYLENVNCAVACVSGGVDSTVAAIVAKMALGEKVYPVFIDTGFMRENEASAVQSALRGLLDLEVYDFSERVVSAVEGLEDAEEKRKAFRDAFYSAVKAVAREKGCDWVVQGTIKADVVETVGMIKTQHNVLSQELLQRYGLRVIEPLVDLFKHEVRELAGFLGLPKSIVERQPFPGPGLLVRAVGKLTREKLELVRKITSVVEPYFEGKGFSQYFPALWEYNVIEEGEVNGLEYSVFGVKVTGVVSGKRTYGYPVVVTNWRGALQGAYSVYKLFDTQNHPHVLVQLLDKGKGEYLIALRVVLTRDFMSAEVPLISREEVDQLVNEVLKYPSIRAIALDVTPKPPATIEYE